jgi:hypothetical protein
MKMADDDNDKRKDVDRGRVDGEMIRQLRERRFLRMRVQQKNFDFIFARTKRIQARFNAN